MSRAPVVTGSLEDLREPERTLLLSRANAEVDRSLVERVASILERVRLGGDAALVELTREIEGVERTSFVVPRSEAKEALSRVPRELVVAMERSIRNLNRVHRAFMPRTTEVESEPGVLVGRRPDPLGAVGVYAPGGRAAYPSSVLMGVVPARVAGVERIVVCSPPGQNGLPRDEVLAAAALGGATDILALGGAQAIGALAFGTESIARVDRIVGPGNAYVAEAKRQIAGAVGIDSPAGPSEILIIADRDADVTRIVDELVAQAEHDPDASVVALVEGVDLRTRVLSALSARAPARGEIVDAALASRAAVLDFRNFADAVAFARAYAGEHVLLLVADRAREADLLRDLRNAGTVFLGPTTSVAFGDYMTGANHVLPTAGAGRSFSGLSTSDFLRFTTYQRVTPGAAERLARDVVPFAELEGLFAHADAARSAASFASADADPIRPPVRRSVDAFPRYVAEPSSVRIDLSDNTNQLGPSPAARLALSSFAAAEVARYPSHYGDALKQAMASHLGVDPSEVATGCGSDDVLDATLRAFTEPGDTVAFAWPTFTMIPQLCRNNGLVESRSSFLDASQEHDVDVDALLRDDPALVYLCSPNNPTGTVVSRRAIEAVLARARGVVVLDQAYVEYGADDWSSRAAHQGRLVVTRTMSKAFGLAGVRVGYAVARRDLIDAIEKVRGPYKLSAIAEALSCATITCDVGWMRDAARDVVGARQALVELLRSIGRSPLPSHANFLLVPVDDANARSEELAARGIGVRSFRALPGIGDALRISIGPRALMEPLDRIFREVLR